MNLLLFGYALVGAGVVLVVVAPRARRALFGVVVGGGVSLVGFAAGRVLVRGATVHASSSVILPLAGVSLRLDALGAYVELLVALVALASTVFLAGYARGRLAAPGSLSMVSLFILALLVVPTSADVVSFLFAWETMAFSSLVLVALEVERESARRAALWYAALTQGGAALITVGLLSAGHEFSSASFAHWGSLRGGAISTLVLVTTSLGFLSKAGLVPLHVWLPRAHPEAATPVSALMSGAMTTLGVYGFLRVDVTLFAGIDHAWWTLVGVVAALSAMYAAIHAASANDLKRLLAYSTIDVMSLSIALTVLSALSSHSAPRLASPLLLGALGVLGAHALYKPLLFLGAGALERASGTRDLDLMGGLLRRMPWTGAAIVVGAASAIGVPLTAGFGAEWLALQSVFGSLKGNHLSLTLLASLVLVAFALAGGLVTLALVKVVGIGLLSRPRSMGAREASEQRGLATGVLAVLAGAIIGTGLWTGWVAGPVRAACLVVRCSTPPPSRTLTLVSTSSSASVRPLVLALVLAGTVCVIVIVRRWSRVGVRETIAWACGRASLSARMQYTATSFAEPVERVFVDVVRPRVDLDIVGEETRRERQVALEYRRGRDDVVERVMYQPLIRAMRQVGHATRVVANGSVNLYAAYGFVALLIVLVVVTR